MPPTRHAIATTPTHDVTFATDDITLGEIFDIRADRDDFADKLMTNRHGHWNRLGGPGIPVVNVQVRPTDTGAVHTNQDVVDAELRLGNVFHPETRLRMFFDQSFQPIHLLILRTCKQGILAKARHASNHGVQPNIRGSDFSRLPVFHGF